MASVPLTIPDAALPRILTAFASVYGYDPTSGQTQAQFMKAKVITHIKQVVIDYESNQSNITSQVTISSDVNNINIS